MARNISSKTILAAVSLVFILSSMDCVLIKQQNENRQANKLSILDLWCEKKKDFFASIYFTRMAR